MATISRIAQIATIAAIATIAPIATITRIAIMDLIAPIATIINKLKNLTQSDISTKFQHACNVLTCSIPVLYLYVLKSTLIYHV
jgi:hypothetical protein